MPGMNSANNAGNAFALGKTHSNGHWQVMTDMGDRIVLVLHGNIIARRRVGERSMVISTCGWATPTTMRGINAALEAMGYDWRACMLKRVPTLYRWVGGKQETTPLVDGMTLLPGSDLAPALSR